MSAARFFLRAMPLVFVLIWSTGFIVARYGMPHAPPFKFLALRYALSLACFLPWVWWAGVAWPAGRVQWLHLAVTGMLMHAMYLGGVWAAVKAGMGSGLAALFVGLQPVLTALWLSARGSKVSSREWPSTKINSVPAPISTVRATAAGMFPASLRAGMMTETVRDLLPAACSRRARGRGKWTEAA